MNDAELTQTLAESFNALADEVQSLIDHKTILEHKLRFAHEQYQYLADKYAPAVPEVSETLAKLQLPPSLQSTLATKSAVPLPRSVQTDAQHQIALFIREGRRVARKLTAAAEMSSSSRGALSTTLGTDNLTSLSTVLEQDFTVEGQKGQLNCPFSPQQSAVENGEEMPDAANVGVEDSTPHHSADPICAAMYEENVHAPAPAAAASNAQCPIRFMDKHSPEEIAHYVETHKHEIPRSHEVCVRRYQRNEEQIRKLDAKYGNLVNMIQDLSHLHKPMMPEGEHELEEHDRASTTRVENWAHAVSSAGEAGDPDVPEEEQPLEHVADDRESHFDRPLKEVRVGESPSRPWGISVPVFNPSEQHYDQGPESPPPAPVHMPNHGPASTSEAPQRPAGKCPFDHTKFNMGNMAQAFESMAPAAATAARAEPERPHTPVKTRPRGVNMSPGPFQPTFMNPPPPPATETKEDKPVAQPPPQMVFNISGPVFIGYPMEQAMQFMQAWQEKR
ncbi:hypothetical protein CONLIGDRAFT_607799 [Coniochaeta ligniaria NRRL 30616]|uniref:Uncharacterized protein n=1 Tax=Coniochaeta ligniaria NRRL 30616 TaxID=1408157 RepID=A0A1J7JZJ4_9PEZI|nr:hypothetical protein CONLIGDRAFT_607799 [Coniochaeta ligniaria NRRL 30616]